MPARPFDPDAVEISLIVISPQQVQASPRCLAGRPGAAAPDAQDSVTRIAFSLDLTQDLDSNGAFTVLLTGCGQEHQGAPHGGFNQ